MPASRTPASVSLPSFASIATFAFAVRGSVRSAARTCVCSARSANARFDSGVSWKRGSRHERQDVLDAPLDGEALGVEHEVVVLRLLPVDAEMASGDRAVRLLGHADLRFDEGAIVGVEALHHALDARLERRADPHADDVTDRPQKVRRAPAAQHGHASALDELERLVGGVYREAGPVGRHPFPDTRLAFEEADDVAFPAAASCRRARR